MAIITLDISQNSVGKKYQVSEFSEEFCIMIVSVRFWTNVVVWTIKIGAKLKWIEMKLEFIMEGERNFYLNSISLCYLNIHRYRRKQFFVSPRTLRLKSFLIFRFHNVMKYVCTFFPSSTPLLNLLVPECRPNCYGFILSFKSFK